MQDINPKPKSYNSDHEYFLAGHSKLNNPKYRSFCRNECGNKAQTEIQLDSMHLHALPHLLEQ